MNQYSCLLSITLAAALNQYILFFERQVQEFILFAFNVQPYFLRLRFSRTWGHRKSILLMDFLIMITIANFDPFNLYGWYLYRTYVYISHSSQFIRRYFNHLLNVPFWVIISLHRDFCCPIHYALIHGSAK